MAEWLESAPCNTRVTSSNPARATLQKSNTFEITLLAEDHEQSIGIVCEPLIVVLDSAHCYATWIIGFTWLSRFA